jgi:hypothetical protein
MNETNGKGAKNNFEDFAAVNTFRDTLPGVDGTLPGRDGTPERIRMAAVRRISFK